MGCMGQSEYEVDVVSYAVENMDPDIRAQMEVTDSGHLSAQKRDPLTQTRGLQELLFHATLAEKSVLDTRDIVLHSTQSVLAAVPGLSALAAHAPPSATFTGGSATC